jgi:hypothetical protein
MSGVWHWLVHQAGVDYGAPYGRWVPYDFWSGAGSDLSEVALLGGLIGFLRHRNCEVKGCWRLGRHQTAAQHNVCRKHHPDDHLTAGQVIDAHQAAITQRNQETG